ncbi:MAG: hypothetical protein MUC88_18835 [Planctomycetes bacterium]|jgi:hypothetical protein|nr:hypothetical protein [Planctomycetota bacterium]
MKRLPNRRVCLAVLATVACLALLVPLGQAVASESGSSPGAAVFEMKYRGLDAPDDPLSYRSYWGFGSGNQASAQNDPFVRAVKSRVTDCSIIENPYVPKARFSVVELKDKKPVAYYFDLNADGQVSEKEKFSPAAPAGPRFSYPYAFITSDFTLRTQDEREVPFRIMVVGYPMESDRVSFMCSPCCVLEGEATLAGTPMRLVLYANGFQGSFTDFGACSFALLPAGQASPAYLPRNTLSSLINHEGTFYRLKLQGTHARDSALRVVVEKDTAPTGQGAIDLGGKEGMKTRLSGVRIQGEKDSTIHFSVADTRPTFPTGQYRIASGYVSYGAESNSEWNVSFNGGPSFDIKAAETTRLDLGKPVLTISAIDERDRYSDNAQERTTYTKGASIYLAPQIKGKAGEVYMRFARKNAKAGNFEDVKPHFRITDSGGKQVASGDMEYG